MRFLLKDEHLVLLKAARVTWDDCEYGAPAINCKRPYGNSDVEDDVCRALGWKTSWFDDEYQYTYEQRARAAELHRETATALQIVLQSPQSGVSPGWYEKPEVYGSRWSYAINQEGS